MRRILAILVLLTLMASTRVDESSSDGMPNWMAGCWKETAADRWTEECWTAPRGGIMLGGGRNGIGKSLRAWETTQIVANPDGGLTFWASPEGAPRVAFPMVSQGANEIVFVNPAHDYPQRIRYWREGRSLNAETSLVDGGNIRRWHYERDTRAPF